ncbi:stage III sporulation protein AA [Clostridium sp. DL1XJH146]
MGVSDLYYLLPNDLILQIEELEQKEKINEIRIRINKPIQIFIGTREKIINYSVDEKLINIIFQKISNYSKYSVDEELKQGYITVNGGHRVGICGSCVMEHGSIKTIKKISSFNIRICREIKGCSKKILPYLFQNGDLMSAIIISPPKCGKTTIIRDLSKNLSDGFMLNQRKVDGVNVSIIDERSEIAGCYNGIPQLDVGKRTDVLDNCLKSEGIIMAIRSMSPDVIICDEIGTENDIKSIINATNSGIKLVVTIHGYGIEDLLDRKVFKRMDDYNILKRAFVLSNSNGIGTVEYVYDFTTKKKIEGMIC